MKSKKPNSNKNSWNPYDKNVDHSNSTSSKENSLVSQRMRENTSDISISVDPLAINVLTNPVNNRVLQVFPSSLSSPSPQPVGVNIYVVRPSVKSNMPIPQDQNIANSAKLNMNSLAIPYNNN